TLFTATNKIRGSRSGSRQKGHANSEAAVLEGHGGTAYFDSRRPAKNVEQHLHALARRKNPQHAGAHSFESATRHKHFGARRQLIICLDRVRLKINLQFAHHVVGYLRNPAAKIHQGSDAVGVAQVVNALIDDAAHKEVAREQRFMYPHHAAARDAFESESWAKYLEGGEPGDVGRGNVLMFGLGANAVPAGD